MRYRYYIAPNKVVCVSSFAGQPVKGYAKCDTSCDEFNEETGRKLAQLRCDEKVTKKRVLRARKRHHEALKALGNAKEYLEKMQRYYDDAFKDFVAANDARIKFEESLK